MTTKTIDEIKSTFFDFKEALHNANILNKKLAKQKELQKTLDALPEKLSSDEYWIKSGCERELKNIEKEYGREGKFNNSVKFTKAQLETLMHKRQKMMDDMKKITGSLKKILMILYHQRFRYGFSFAYGVSDDDNETYIQVSHDDFHILASSYEETGTNFWPLKMEGQYFVPAITVVDYLPPPFESMSTDQYINQLLRYTDFRGRNAKILGCLLPYAEQLYCRNTRIYFKLQNKYEDFPKYDYLQDTESDSENY